MLHLRRAPRPSDDISTEKSTASESYRRTSIPNIVTSSTPSIALSTSSGIPHRAPLAPLDPQSAYIAYPVLPDDQIIGRPIVARRTSSDDSGSSSRSARRRSISNHSVAARSPSSSSHRTQLRRPSYTSASYDSSRRPSLPTIHAEPGTLGLISSGTAYPNPTTFTNPDFGSLGSEDMYSDLASFTFGAARSVIPDATENVSPLTPVSGPAFPDRNPRPSVSGPSAGGLFDGIYQSRATHTHATQGSYVDENGRPFDDNVDEEAVRQSRSKMRAMNDGSRRPSLPINSYQPGEPTSSVRHSPSDGSARQSPEEESQTYRERKGGHDPDHSPISVEDDGDNDGDFDTDVELDFPHDALSVDGDSLHTFGATRDSYGHSTEDLSYGMDIDRDDHDPRVTRLDIAPWDTQDDHDTSSPGGTVAPSAGQSNSIARNARGSGSENGNRGREDSTSTTVARRRTSCSAEGGPDIPSASADAALKSSSTSVANGDAYAGLNLEYILGSLEPGGTRSSWSFDVPSYIASPGEVVPPRKRSGLGVEFNWGLPLIGSRRPSAATTASGEDTFTRHIRKNDPQFEQINKDWTFIRESADGDGRAWFIPVNSGSHSSENAMPGTQQIWRHAFVGRFKVDRIMMHSDDPARPPQQRMNVRHILDPYSQGNTHGGPTAVVHKHSRAPAFSIFRMYGLLGRGMRSTAHNTSVSILLATRKVQEHYTSTRTTSQLNSHGLLRDGQIRSGETRGSDSSQDHTLRSDKSTRSGKDKKDKGKSRDGYSSNLGTSSGDSSMGSAASHSTKDDGRGHMPSQSMSSIAMSPTVVGQSRASVAVSSPTSERSEATLPGQEWTSSKAQPHADHPSLGLTLPRTDLHPSVDDDYMMPPRTSHAEAFATLDANSIEYLRGRTDQRSSDRDSARSGLSRWRRLLGQGVRGPSGVPNGLPSAPLEGHYNPPWLTMAPRSQQEERERVLQNLNESFKDVGLLPTLKPRHSRSKNLLSRKAPATVDILEKVPQDALHMLLPLWPGETDPATAAEDRDASTYHIPIEERQYLLVYYVPFQWDQNKKEVTKKRTRGETLSGGSTTEKSPKTVELTAFRVVARLISYRYLLGTGVRLPVHGLSITGPMSAALALLPPSAYVRPQDQDDIIIGRCTNVDKQVNFDPEGLAKLGLCKVVDEDEVDGPSGPPFDTYEEGRPPAWELTPIGRAAVEMAWLGSLAVTSFGENSVPGATR